MMGSLLLASHLTYAAIESQEEAFKALQAPSFELREEATFYLWKQGKSAYSKLSVLRKSPDPEVSQRAKLLIDYLKYEITPQTPPKIAESVNKYLKTNKLDVKRQMIMWLYRNEALGQVLRLYTYEEDETSRQELQKLVFRMVVTKSRERLYAKQEQSLVSFLESVPYSPVTLPILGAIDEKKGALSDRLESFLTMGELEAAIYYAALLGDLDRYEELAKELYHEKALQTVAFMKGDPWSYLWGTLKEREGYTIWRHYLKAAENRWHGSMNSSSPQVLKTLLNSHEESNQAMSSLLGLGDFKEVKDYYARHFEKLKLFDFYSQREDVTEALEIYGLVPGEPLSKEWLQEFLEPLTTDWFDHINRSKEALNLISYFEGKGVPEYAIQLRTALFAVIENHDPETKEEFFIDLFQEGLHDEMFYFLSQLEDPRPLLKVYDLEQSKMHNDSLAKLLLWLDEEIAPFEQELDGALDEWQLKASLQGVLRMNSHPLKEKVIKSLVLKSETNPELSRDWLTNLIYLTSLQNDIDRTLPLVERFQQTYPKDLRWNRALVSFYQATQQWDKAILLQATHQHSDQSLEGVLKESILLHQAGRHDQAQKKYQKVKYFALNDPYVLDGIHRDYTNEGLPGVPEGLVTRSCLLDALSKGRGDPLTTRTALLKDEAIREKDWAKAAACSEAIVFAKVKDGETKNIATYQQVRFEAEMFRGFSLLTTDPKLARKRLATAHSRMRGDGILADHFFPLLHELGLKKELKEYFNISFQYLEETIQVYPKSANTLNSAAWLASRALQRLDRAQNYAKRANGIEIHSAAYMDTMAEVFFAQGDRARAISWSQKAVIHGMSDRMIKQQFYRFLRDPLPKK